MCRTLRRARGIESVEDPPRVDARQQHLVVDLPEVALEQELPAILALGLAHVAVGPLAGLVPMGT